MAVAMNSKEDNPNFITRTQPKEPAKTVQSKKATNTFSSTYNYHRALRPWELWMDDVKFKWREMRQPLTSWKMRHFLGLYALSRFVMRPILYFPGILCFYCLQPGRR
eukprot:CAMPEP_0197033680 /NCGR_PEP_ID=MMETSP1384-20130603/12028_1 /TAXON_ID=29189 /ORGANISM="Ammonia sp." /LENGTH=106 /DNA_ID=CAMNT_0042463521 /DNA_START=19 /DNA_END=335 /DNA_ORIENTATION=+